MVFDQCCNKGLAGKTKKAKPLVRFSRQTKTFVATLYVTGKSPGNIVAPSVSLNQKDFGFRNSLLLGGLFGFLPLLQFGTTEFSSGVFHFAMQRVSDGV